VFWQHWLLPFKKNATDPLIMVPWISTLPHRIDPPVPADLSPVVVPRCYLDAVRRVIQRGLKKIKRIQSSTGQISRSIVPIDDKIDKRFSSGRIFAEAGPIILARAAERAGTQSGMRADETSGASHFCVQIQTDRAKTGMTDRVCVGYRNYSSVRV
jgi:hypothetical protein